MLISIWLTNACNLRCKYCYQDRSDFTSMDENTINKIIEFINYNNLQKNETSFVINFYGGEPLLKFQLIQLFVEKTYNIMKKSSVRFSNLITTNGTLLTENIIDYLKKNKFRVSLSLDGLPEIHNKNRIMENGKDCFKIVFDKLPYLLKSIPETFARLTYDHESVYSLSAGVEFLAGIGFKNIKPVPDFFDTLWSEKDVDVLQKEVDKSMELVKNYADTSLLIPDAKDIKIKCGRCKGGINQFYISPGGDVYPCSYVVGDENYLLGNISNGYEGLLNPPHINKNYEFKCCEGCTYFKYCDATRCIYLNYKCTGMEDMPPAILCEYEKYLYKVSIR